MAMHDKAKYKFTQCSRWSLGDVELQLASELDHAKNKFDQSVA